MVKASENNNESQIPSTSSNKGNVKTNKIWKISVLQNEIIALMRPLLSEVKNEEPKIANPAKK